VLYAGSLTKIFTAVLTLGLVEEGTLRLAEPVAGIGRDASEVTVAHLLTHASGLAREGHFGYWFSADFPDRPALTRYLADTELRSPPGAALHYSNVGYGALGLMVERATGQAYGAALRARVLQPLGMASSGAPGPAPDVAAGYTPVGRIIPSEERPFAGVGRQVGQRHLREYHDARAMSPAFGAFTTARDLGRLTRFLLGHGGDAVLSTEMRARMHTRQASGWGLGLKVGRYQDRPVARHEGWFAAHRSHLLLDLGDEIGVAVLSNSDSAAPAVIAEALFAATLNGHPEWEQ
jgi:CubicO group peptidase (beta-lactamase class C family)